MGSTASQPLLCHYDRLVIKLCSSKDNWLCNAVTNCFVGKFNFENMHLEFYEQLTSNKGTVWSRFVFLWSCQIDTSTFDRLDLPGEWRITRLKFPRRVWRRARVIARLRWQALVPMLLQVFGHLEAASMWMGWGWLGSHFDVACHCHYWFGSGIGVQPSVMVVYIWCCCQLSFGTSWASWMLVIRMLGCKIGVTTPCYIDLYLKVYGASLAICQAYIAHKWVPTHIDSMSIQF